MSKLVSVIISNRNDLAILGVTVRSSLEELSPFGKDGDIVICDNSQPEHKKNLPGVIPEGYVKEGKVSIIHQNFPCLFTAREAAIRHSDAKYIVCLDSHMLVGHNMIVDLIEFLERMPQNVGFAHAPISWCHHHESRAKHDRVVSEHELGPWGGIHSNEARITWKGMPWACRRDWFLKDLNGYGALSQHRLSWGGGDMHIGYKPWLLGFENWAVPTRPGIHIGPFPSLAGGKAAGNDPFSFNKYRVYTDSGQGPACLGFLVSCFILGGEEMMHRNKKVLEERFSKYINIQRQWDKAKMFGADERKWLLEHQVISFEELLANPPWEISNRSEPNGNLVP